MFADRVKEARKIRGHTQESLAEIMNVGKMTISRWERNEALPDMDNIILLAKVLDVSSDYLLGIDNHPDDHTLENRVIERLRVGDKMGAVREIVNDG